jgi:hypothetical protein
MPVVQIIAVTTAEIGPNGPVKKIYAVGFDTADAAVEEMQKRLKAGEVAQWIDARHLSLAPNEVRQI